MDRLFGLLEKGLLFFIYWLEQKKSARLEKDIAIANEKNLTFKKQIKSEKLKAQKEIDKAYENLLNKLKERR